jgi:hypothetical protein
MDIAEQVIISGLMSAWLKLAQLTKSTLLVMDYCKEPLGISGTGIKSAAEPH